MVQTIKQDRNAVWLGMGDYSECITRTDKRWTQYGIADWVVRDNIVESQREWVVDLLKPIASKCVGLLTGNHEEKIHTWHDNDITRNICKDLGVPYASYTSYILLNFKRLDGTSREYKIHAWHGAGTAQTEGARLQRLMRLVNEFTAHLYLMGHLHAMTLHIPDRIDCIGGRLKSQKLEATITGSWVKAYAQPPKDIPSSIAYPEMFGFKPSRIGCPIVHFRPDKDEFTIES